MNFLIKSDIVMQTLCIEGFTRLLFTDHIKN